MLPDDGGSTGDPWSITAQSNTTTESESMRSNDKMKDEPVLTASHVLKEHPFEMRQEDEVPELAAAIQECGVWPRVSSTF